MENLNKNINILYVEDNPIDVDLTLNYFEIEAPEFKFTIAKTAKEFFELADKSKFDIYLLDNNLPDALGIDIVQKLYDLRNKIPIVLVTGLGDQEVVIKALRLGAVDYISKDSDYLPKLIPIFRKIYSDYQKNELKYQKILQEKIDVLYVERSEIDKDLTKTFFEKETNFINLIFVSTAGEAIKLLERNKNIKVILSDLKLPDVSGLDLLHELKIKGINIPFIMITGFGDEKTALASLKLGAYDYILKSQNYLEKLPLAIINAYYKYNYEIKKINRHQDLNFTESREQIFRERTLELISTIEDKENLLNELKLSHERYRAYIENSFESISRFEMLEPIDIHQDIDLMIENIYNYSVLKEYNKAFIITHNFLPLNNLNDIKIGKILPRLAGDNLSIIKKFIKNNFSIENEISKELSAEGSVRYYLTNLFGVIENEKLIRIWSTKRDITDLKRAEEEVIKLNQELEKRVEERTRALEISNKELESFSYSISHDLRAPLRSIIGYSNIIKEDYIENIPIEVNKLLDNVIKNASYMGHLIEDLLRLSRVTQQGIVKKITDIKEIFNKCISETQATNYKFIINDLPLIPADPSLIEIAIRNLVNNAIKFSRTVENPTIEINGEENDNEVIYSIKDNGVGFNMEYYDKIFIAFQRLHSTDKFEGTGIGLSIVQRIIKKHGGNVWAEGKENEGATFYFSLPKK